jgi:site-specific recombinase XerD
MSGTRRKPGPMGPFVESYGSYLGALGYTPQTVRGQLKVLGQLGRWMTAESVRVADLDVERIDAFLAYRRADHYRGVPGRRPLLQLRQHLIDQGVVPVEERRPVTELDHVVETYRQWLACDRGLAETTIIRYVNTARRFLQQRDAGVDVTGLQLGEVTRFLLAETQRCSVGAAKGRVAEMRSLLRFLFVTGRTPVLLAGSVPPVAGWHNTGIPPVLPAGSVQRLLDSCDRSTRDGVRDFAILMLLSRLAWRSIEVARLQLQDVQWRTGEITVRGKGGRVDRMPLPVDVGEALSSYLVHGRASSPARQMFLTTRAPQGPIRAELVGDVVQRACVRAGVPQIGPHRLRHAVATTMVRQGVALADISQVLRHRDLATTAIYAKIDLASLRAVARPWPGTSR